MSDVSDLVTVVGELELELEALFARDPEAGALARQRAATLIPPLGREDAPGWYTRLLEATGVERPDADLDAALARLARPASSVISHPHRVAVLGAVGRAAPHLPARARRTDRILDALAMEGIVLAAGPPGAADEPTPRRDDAAAALHGALLDTDVLPHIGHWRSLVESEGLVGVIDPVLRAAPAPCSTHVVPVHTRTGERLAVALRTDVCVSGVTLARATDATGFMNPANWAGYEHWCGMDPDPQYNPQDWEQPCRFLESVALDCDTGWSKVAVWLDFTEVVRGTDVAYREYAMTDLEVAPPGGNDSVTVDEGVFVVRAEGDHVRVTSTKRVEFREGIDDAVLAVVACASGYGDLATAFVVHALGGEAHAVSCAAAPDGVGATGTFAATSTAGETLPIDPVDGPAGKLEVTLGECVDAARSSLSRVAAGDYTLDDLARDVVGSAFRSVRAVAEAGEVLVVLADPPPVLDRVVSDRFEVPPAPAGTTGPCALAIDEGLTSLRGHTLKPPHVQCVPASLPAGERTFRLVSWVAGRPSGAYRGTVKATHPGSGSPVDVAVDLVVE